MRAEERRDRALAQAIALFVLEMLKHAITQVSRSGAVFFGIEGSRIRSNTQVIIRVVIIQSILAKLAPPDIIKPNNRDQRMQHIAAIKAVQLQIQIVQENLLIPRCRFIQHNEQVIFYFVTDLLSANFPVSILSVKQHQEIVVAINSTMRVLYQAIRKQLALVNCQIRAIHHQIHMHILVFTDKAIFQTFKKFIEAQFTFFILWEIFKVQRHAVASIFKFISVERECIHKSLEIRINLCIQEGIDFKRELIKKFF